MCFKGFDTFFFIFTFICFSAPGSAPFKLLSHVNYMVVWWIIKYIISFTQHSVSLCFFLEQTKNLVWSILFENLSNFVYKIVIKQRIRCRRELNGIIPCKIQINKDQITYSRVNVHFFAIWFKVTLHVLDNGTH